MRIWIQTIGALTVAFAASAGCMQPTEGLARQSVSTSPADNDREVTLEAAAVALALSAGAVEKIWPDAWPRDHRVILGLEGGRALLVGPHLEGYEGPIEPASFRMKVPDEAHGLIWDLPDVTLFSQFRFDFPLGRGTLFASTVIPALTHFDDPAGATLVFLYHEHFHKYQDGNFAEAFIDTEAMFRALARNPRAIPEVDEKRLLQVERGLLGSALVAETPEAALAFLRSYYERIETRATRVLRAGEEYGERIEGTATYFSYMATAEALGLSQSQAVAFFLRDLELTYPEDVGRGIEGVRNWHKYAVGAAKSLLAARMVPSWQQRVAAGETLDDVLMELLH